jgi:hypothetical protein
VTTPADDREVLRAAALGGEPGWHPLPPARDDEGRWWRAVALGGQGRYAGAAAELERLASPTTTAWLRSLALSTRGSHLRQLGGHLPARRLDGCALALAGGVPGRAGATARSDALVGLAADALGPGRVALARRLLALAAHGLAGADERCAVRWHWVAAETALCDDERDEAAAHAGTALRLAASTGSVRHELKSSLVVAAATGSGEVADRVRTAAAQHDLLPLRWAATMLLLAIEGPRSGSPAEGELRHENTASHAMLTVRGGALPGAPTSRDLVRSWSTTAATGPAPVTRVRGGSPDRGQGGVKVVR